MPVAVQRADDPRVSILVVVYGGAQMAVAAVAAVVENTHVPFEVIVVDNSSPDGAFQTLTRELAGAVVVQAETNLGFGGGNNRAAELATAPVLVLLNPDTRVQPGWLEPLLTRLGSPGVGAVAPALIDADGNVIEAGAVVDHWGNTAPPMRRDFAATLDVGTEPYVVDYASAACLAIRTDLFADLGGFDAAYHLAYYEDVDLCFRVWERGLEVWCEPASRVEHVRGGGGDPAAAVELWNRNRSVFLTRWSAELEKRPALTGSDDDLALLARWRRDRVARATDATSTRRRQLSEWGAWAVVCVIALIVLERLHTPRTFFYDEWNFVFDRRDELDSYLEAHNGHLSLIPVIVYRVGLSMFGLDQYRPFRVLGLLVHLVVATGVYVYVRRRVGTWTGVAAGTLIAFLGSGWQNIVWPFQIGSTGSLAAALLAWLALDHQRKRADALASALLVVALACSGVGVAVVAGTAARLAAERSWRRLVVVLVAPVVLYGAWYVRYGQSQGSTENIPLIPRFVVDAAASGVGGLGGRDLLWGRLLLGLIIGAAVVLVLLRKWPSPAIVAPAAAALSSWVLIAYSRANFGDVGASRYAYVSAVFVVLVVVEIVRVLPRKWSPAVAVTLALLGVWGNAQILRAGAAGYRSSSAVTRSELRALEWARDKVAPEFRPDLSRMPQVDAGRYFAAVDEFGSAAASDGEVEAANGEARLEVDRVSWEALDVALSPPVAAATPLPATVQIETDEVVDISNGCPTILPGPDGGALALLHLPAGEPMEISAAAQPVEVRVRRYAPAFTEGAQVDIAPGVTEVLMIPRDIAPRHVWFVELRSADSVTLCGAAK